jgi:hypothetical protein
MLLLDDEPAVAFRDADDDDDEDDELDDEDERLVSTCALPPPLPIALLPAAPNKVNCWPEAVAVDAGESSDAEELSFIGAAAFSIIDAVCLPSICKEK